MVSVLHKANLGSKRHSSAAAKLLIMLFVSAGSVTASETSRDRAIKLVSQVQRADYEGDRSALRRLHDELAPFAGNKNIAARVQYWRGFALWRRAINGFNESVSPEELQTDLKQALTDFDDAAKKEPAFGDAKIAALSCVSLIGAS